jgi:hypothetical protein
MPVALHKKCLTSLGIRTGSGSDRVASNLTELLVIFAPVASVGADPVATAPGSDTATSTDFSTSCATPMPVLHISGLRMDSNGIYFAFPCAHKTAELIHQIHESALKQFVVECRVKFVGSVLILVFLCVVFAFSAPLR